MPHETSIESAAGQRDSNCPQSVEESVEEILKSFEEAQRVDVTAAIESALTPSGGAFQPPPPPPPPLPPTPQTVTTAMATSSQQQQQQQQIVQSGCISSPSVVPADRQRVVVTPNAAPLVAPSAPIVLPQLFIGQASNQQQQQQQQTTTISGIPTGGAIIAPPMSVLTDSTFLIPSPPCMVVSQQQASHQPPPTALIAPAQATYAQFGGGTSNRMISSVRAPVATSSFYVRMMS